MRENLQFYIDGGWTEPRGTLRTLDVENPATEAIFGRIAAGSVEDVDRAVDAARKAFPSWSRSTRTERLDLLNQIVVEYNKRAGDLADAVTEEMGAPVALAKGGQVPASLSHITTAIKVLETFEFEEDRGSHRIFRDPIGVCGLITPWNWPIGQATCKIAPALATGCTMVLKPSEVSPFSGQILAEILHAAGVPAGVFNMVQGDGPTVGQAIASHPGVDMVSFTGSTRAGIEVARAAAPTVKRVAQELGGKSPNIILDDEAAVANVTRGAAQMMMNTGQVCAAPSRMLVPSARMEELAAVAKRAAEGVVVGDPRGNSQMGPVVNKAQFDRVQRLIQAGIDEGATLMTGGLGRPEGLERGYFVRPTVFANVTNDMTIAREEIFGPVLSILGYDSVEQAIEIGNDTPYGLAAHINGADPKKISEIARHIRAGQIWLSGAGGPDRMAPFGGYKQSGNGREWGDYGFHEYLETKAIVGYAA